MRMEDYYEFDYEWTIEAKHEIKENSIDIYAPDKLWAKACFEYTDFGTNAVVTVMTNERSDDANGINVDSKEMWLQIARKDNVFAIHYSFDGEEFVMARLAHLPMPKKIFEWENK